MYILSVEYLFGPVMYFKTNVTYMESFLVGNLNYKPRHGYIVPQKKNINQKQIIYEEKRENLIPMIDFDMFIKFPRLATASH